MHTQPLNAHTHTHTHQLCSPACATIPIQSDNKPPPSPIGSSAQLFLRSAVGDDAGVILRNNLACSFRKHAA